MFDSYSVWPLGFHSLFKIGSSANKRVFTISTGKSSHIFFSYAALLSAKPNEWFSQVIIGHVVLVPNWLFLFQFISQRFVNAKIVWLQYCDVV